MKLTKENPETKPFAFEGTMNLIIYNGKGTVRLYRSVSGSPFFPVSLDTSGTPVEFYASGDGECAYNGTLEEKGLGATYKLVADVEAGEIEYVLSKVKNAF